MSKKTKRQIEDEKDYGGRSLFDLIELEFSQGEENEQQNRELSEHREVTDNIERTSISSNTPSVDRQENSTIQLDNTREMGRVLSEHNQESRNVRSNDTSIATNTNGISNLGEQRSRQEERTGANRHGDTSRRANKSQSIHSDRTPNLFSFISRNDDERQGADARRNNQQSVLETATRNDGYERRSLKSGQKLDFISDDEIYLGSLKDRFQKNLQAIKLSKTIEQENRYATKQEQEILNKFSGWGGIPQAFDHQNKEWEKEFKELISTLDYAEYEKAKTSTLDAFYTPKIIIDTIYQGLNQLGFNNDGHTKEIFEPSAGIGSFLSYAKNYSDKYHFTCVELDTISANILKHLHPNQTIYNKAFQHHLFDKPYDAFIGNPPFGQKKILDLIGSTQKMGAGTNVQKRIVALHHLDCPWRPSDLEQRSGRVIRQGNELFMRDPQNFRVKEFRYATERTYDARMWQVIESKARSIEQFRKAGADVRTLEDVTSGAADAAEMKAEATGNPLILLQVQLNSDLRQEEMLYSGYKRQIHNNEESLITNLSKIELLKKDIAKMEILNSIIKENNSEHFQGKYYINDDEKDFIVFKNDTSDLNKSRQAELERNFEKIVKTIADDYQKEYKVLEFKGLLISG